MLESVQVGWGRNKLRIFFGLIMFLRGMKDIKKLKNVWYNLVLDHSKWVVSENADNSSKHWT